MRTKPWYLKFYTLPFTISRQGHKIYTKDESQKPFRWKPVPGRLSASVVGWIYFGFLWAALGCPNIVIMETCSSVFPSAAMTCRRCFYWIMCPPPHSPPTSTPLEHQTMSTLAKTKTHTEIRRQTQRLFS